MKNRIKIFSFMVSAALIFLSIGPLPATAASYDDIAFGITYQNSLSYATDTNFYYFTADSPGRITIRFETSTATNTLSWRVAIVNESDLKIYLTQDFGSGAASPASASTRIEYTETVQIPSGDYYVLVSVPLSAYYVTSQYKITVGFAEFSQGSGDASFSTLTSPNASARNASAMELNTTMTQNLKSASDTNYFKITVPYHGALVLSFSVESGIDSGDWTILLYDQNEKQLQLGRMGVGGDVINKIRTNKLDRLRLPPGEYYIKVAAYSPSAFSTANYSIYADYTAEKSSEYEKEFNDTLESATNILINAPVTGNLSNAEDRDYFRFTVSDHRELKMMFSSPGSLESNMWTIYLLDAKGGIATYRAGRSGEVANGIRVFESEKLTLEPGLYYIVIYRFEEAYFNGNYTLLVHSDTAPVPGVQDSEYAYPTQTPDYSYNINTELTGQIKGAGDQNTFDFGLSYSGSVSLDFVSPAAVVKQSWIANIFDKNNRLLTSVKCGESGALGALGDTKVTTSDKIRVPAGSYYVQVLPINAYDYSTASYKIKINYSPEAKEATFSSVESFETEYNNSPYTANALSFGSPMTANLS
ncbi:MAG: pre-peptidase C-terminal domain-containing protein, partial [Oscillospiraceae bacterium]|nr:pre-peptidase C-terminal domain-containing protein [Oscillospiraceae bacterium]